MKTKLLKRIRRDYKIYYYPERDTPYQVTDDLEGSYFTCYLYLLVSTEWHKTLQDAKDNIMARVRIKYYEHSKAYKLSQIKKKVWHLK